MCYMRQSVADECHGAAVQRRAVPPARAAAAAAAAETIDDVTYRAAAVPQ